MGDFFIIKLCSTVQPRLDKRQTDETVPVNRSFSADDLVTIRTAVFNALVDALDVLLQLVVERESFHAHLARERLHALRRVLPESDGTRVVPKLME